MLKQIYEIFTHLIGRITKRYYFEDYVRVYPNGIVYNRSGIIKKADEVAINNYLNHCKFYNFVSQFVRDKNVVDVGCGSGYGCEILKKAGASLVYGCDISRQSIRFAKKRFSSYALFQLQGITNLAQYNDGQFDITISSEVLEHIKEYGMEDKAVKELKRITVQGGFVIVGTPNSEMLGDHGFYFDEIDELFRRNFSKYCIFENALLPFDQEGIKHWEKRMAEGRVGKIVSEEIKISETVVPKNITPNFKKGLSPGITNFENLEINTEQLHNTHSWLVIARKD